LYIKAENFFRKTFLKKILGSIANVNQQVYIIGDLKNKLLSMYRVIVIY